MQATYSIKAEGLTADFLQSLKNMFSGQEIEITVKTVGPKEMPNKNQLVEMIRDNRNNAPIISPNIDIRALIDESQYHTL